MSNVRGASRIVVVTLALAGLWCGGCAHGCPEVDVDLDAHEALGIQLVGDPGSATVKHEGMGRENAGSGNCQFWVYAAPGDASPSELPEPPASNGLDDWTDEGGWAIPGGRTFSGELTPNPDADGVTTFVLHNRRPEHCEVEWRVFLDDCDEDSPAKLRRVF